MTYWIPGILVSLAIYCIFALTVLVNTIQCENLSKSMTLTRVIIHDCCTLEANDNVILSKFRVSKRIGL